MISKLIIFFITSILFLQCSSTSKEENKKKKTDKINQENTYSITKEKNTNIRTGDIIFQISQSSQSKAIQLATHSKYSHMGIIIFKNKLPYVFEASKTTQYTPLNEWTERGENKHFIIKRINSSSYLHKVENEKKIISPVFVTF